MSLTNRNPPKCDPTFASSNFGTKPYTSSGDSRERNGGSSYHPMRSFGLDNTVNGQKHGEMTISEVAREYAITLRALRFYEDKGLLFPRRVGQTRLYGVKDKERIKAILKGKRLGFTLNEIREFLNMPQKDASRGSPNSQAVQATGTTAKIGAIPDSTRITDLGFYLSPEQITSQISHLERQRALLDEAIAKLKSTHDTLTHLGA